MANRRRSAWDRFWEKVDASGDCWQWTAGTNGRGYGSLTLGGKAGRRMSAHRFAWMALVDAIPEDRELDHLCGNKLCVNPDHLEPVTHRENARRKLAKSGPCRRGHVNEWSSQANGRLRCGGCHREREAARRAAS